MSMRTYTTTAIDCDQCDEVYSDVVDVQPYQIEIFAIRDGWHRLCSADGTVRHLCPRCRKRLDATID